MCTQVSHKICAKSDNGRPPIHTEGLQYEKKNDSLENNDNDVLYKVEYS